MVFHPRTSRVISNGQALRALLGQPTEMVRSKIADRLLATTRPFIEHSPFVCVATSGPNGTCDVSPRGDPRGFVRILDDRTLLLPERPGNRLADTLTNILHNGRVGLLFLLPGIGDTFRVNGRATLTDDPELLAPSTVEGKAPRLGILVDIEEAFTQCSKALLRSQLWDASRHLPRESLPSLGEIHKEMRCGEFDAEAFDEERAQRYARRDGFY